MKLPRLKSRLPRSVSPSDDDLLAGALPERASIAHERLAHQYDPALTEALSQRELSAQRELAEKIRDYERGEQLARIEAAQSAADRVRRTRDQLADNEAKDLVRAAQAIAEQRRAASPHAKVARLHRRKNFVLGILTGVVAFAMVFSAVTVQHNIIPDGNPGDLMWWLAYGLETLISGMLIALMISTSDTAEWEVIENPWVVYGIEGVLLAVTVTLNVYPFWKSGDHFGVGVHAIAPITIGTALATHGVVSKRYGDAIAKATAQVPDAEDLTGRLAALTRIGTPEHPSTVQTVHHVPSYRPAPSETEQDAIEDATHGENTVHRAPADDSAAVHRAPGARRETEQFASTVHPSTVQHGEADRTKLSGAETEQPGVHTVQHGVQVATLAPASADYYTPAELARDDDGSTALDRAVTTPAAAETEQDDAETVDAPARTVQGVSDDTDPEGPGPSTRQEETEQFASTPADTVHPRTVHRAPVTDTVHRAPAGTVQETVHPETAHRAPSAATDQLDDDDTYVWSLAAEVHGRLKRSTKFSVEDIARVLLANRRDGYGPDRIYRDKLGPHRDTNAKWIQSAAAIEAERAAAMAPVITLRERG